MSTIESEYSCIYISTYFPHFSYKENTRPFTHTHQLRVCFKAHVLHSLSTQPHVIIYQKTKTSTILLSTIVIERDRLKWMAYKSLPQWKCELDNATVY